MKKTAISLMLCVFLSAVVYAGPGCTGTAVEREIDLPVLFDSSGLSARFGRYYEPVPYDVNPNVPSYTLPLAPGDIYNYSKLSYLLKSEEAKSLFLKNGLVSLNWGFHDDVVKAYESIKDSGFPVFVTSDSLLHLYHIQFDETLKRIEEKEFYPDLKKISSVMRDEFLRISRSSKGLEKEAYLKGAAFFTIGLKLLDPGADVPREVGHWVKWELEHIEKHEGFPPSGEAGEKALFRYSEDYSQYVPRGHYTQSEELKKYFKAMMWYGRLTMLIKGGEKYGPFEKSLVPPEEAKVQTMLAAAIAGLAGELQADGRPVSEKWNRIYSVSAYYVGFSDDLTIYEYRDALRSVFGESFKPSALLNDDFFVKFQARIAGMRKPAIYSGAGESGVNLDLEKDRAMTPEQLARTLAKTQGFRFMGQRYVPDSFILGQMVSPTIDLLTGSNCFTTVNIPDVGPIRGFPRGLDVMAVLGSKRARKILDTTGDSKYGRYDATLDKLAAQFSSVSEKEWNQNLYWSWLYALKSLTSEPGGSGWPTFALTDAWKDKQVNAALGSWSSLRHDTILYVKQSYTMTITAESAEPRPVSLPVVGYVEPVPEFYARLVALTRMTAKGLSDLEVLDEESEYRLQALEGVLKRLLDISVKELENKKLTQDDYNFIADFAERINSIVTGASESTQKTTLVADVHTDQNTRQVLEEATGYLRLMLVAYKLPEGHVLIGAGPSYSYYEFKHKMSDRLTDEKWRDMLKSGNAPSLPDWTRTFAEF